MIFLIKFSLAAAGQFCFITNKNRFVAPKALADIKAWTIEEKYQEENNNQKLHLPSPHHLCWAFYPHTGCRLLDTFLNISCPLQVKFKSMYSV